MTSKVNVEENNSSLLKHDEETTICERILVGLSYFIFVITFPISWIVCIRVANEFERAVIFRLGKVNKVKPLKGPGLFFILPCVDESVLIDLRIQTYNIPPQEILTKDSVTVKVDAIVNYLVVNPFDFVVKIKDGNVATQFMAQTALRNVLGTKDLTSLLSDKDRIAELVKQNLENPTQEWGINVKQVEIKDVQLPIQLQRSMAAEAEAAREAKAKIVAALGELESSKSLKEAALTMGQAPFALQLRYLQTLCTISAEKNSTIVFPLPIELLQNRK